MGDDDLHQQALVQSLAKATGISRGTSPWQDALRAVFEGGVDAITGALGVPMNGSRASQWGELLAAGLPVMAGVKRIPNPIKAYHGSPHDFEAFSMSKIGTGEGAQAYGHGLYFSENEGVARSYRDDLAKSVPAFNGEPVKTSYESLAHDIIKFSGRDKAMARLDELARLGVFKGPNEAQAIADARETLAANLDKIPNKASQGRMYEVNIHADPEHMLDWDKPLSQQSEHVQQRFPKISIEKNTEPAFSDERWTLTVGDRVHDAFPTRKAAQQAVDNTPLGKLLPSGEWQRSQGGPKVSADLNRLGIPGIKYLDAGSRRNNASLWHDAENNRWGVVHNDPSGTVKTEYFPNEAAATKFRESLPETRNYVVFDDKRIEIVKKYGIAVALAAGLINEGQARQLQAQGAK